MRTIGMSDYTVGEDCFDELPEYGAKKVAIIGGKRALAAALPGIEAALAGTDVEILETRVYGTNSTRANIAKVVNTPACQEADVLIACGGGKALDTVKTAAIELKKIVFTVPTICSNCSAATAIAVVYNDDGSLEGYSYPNRPAHIFINPKIIAEAPAEYFWAGVGDALSKQPEVEYATSAGDLEHTAGLGLALAHTCSEPLFTYGVQGLEDVRQDLSSEAVKQIALDIVVNTGYVSNLTNQNDYYYNSSVAHAFYNATCSIPREGTYLHGEVVSLGVLVLFAYTGDTENLERYATFNKQMGLPVGRLVCASNRNNVLTDFLRTGTYDARRTFYKTTSPSMDILISSNLERLLYHVSGSSEKVAGWMQELSATGKYTVDAETLAKIQQSFAAGYADDADGAAEIKARFDGDHYLCDTHTAVAFRVAETRRTDAPMVVLSTASPFKFPRDVLTALGVEAPASDFAAMAALTAGTGAEAPASLRELDKLEVRFKTVLRPADIRTAALR